MPEVSVAELDVGMRMLYPRASQSSVRKDVEASRSAGYIRRRKERGVDAHVIQDPVIGLTDFNIPVRRVELRLEKFLPRIKKFEVEGGVWSWSEEKAPLCFGFGSHLFIKVERNRDGTVSHIWFDSMTEEEEEITALREAFNGLDEICSMLIADYWTKDVGLISDPAFMKSYMSRLVAVPEPPQPWFQKLYARLLMSKGPKRAKARAARRGRG